ncbi:MAG: hypothetical protein V2G43_02840 [bacterium JZ-2024 1]
MVLCGGMGMGRQGWASSGPEEKPADTSSRQVEGFYLGCRWIASPKDIPVPQEKIKEWENLLDRVKMTEKGRREFMIQLWTLTYQSEQFRKGKMKAQRRISQKRGNGVEGRGRGGMFNVMLAGEGDTCRCGSCRWRILATTLVSSNCEVPDENLGENECERCAYCVHGDGSTTEFRERGTLTDQGCTADEKIENTLITQSKLCGCGGGQEAGECGRLQRKISVEPTEPLTYQNCCLRSENVYCKAPLKAYISTCEVKCKDDLCPSILTCVKESTSDREGYLCNTLSYLYYDCTECCYLRNGQCQPDPEKCPSCEPGYTKQGYFCQSTPTEELVHIYEECRCVPSTPI